jgi:HEAT repeat protein
LVPQTKRLLYIQEVLLPELKLGNPDARNKVYVVYNYKRGESLQYEYDIFTNAAVTSAIIFEYWLTAEMDNDFYLIEKKKKYAGAGCSSLQHLVCSAVAKVDFFDTLSEEVEKILEKIIGYAIGFNWGDSLSTNQQFALLKFALNSEYWADRDLAKENLLSIANKKALKFFIGELNNENKIVRQTAIEVLGNIKDNRSVDSLIACLSDRDNKIKLAVIVALGKIGDRKAAEPVAAYLDDENLTIRRNVAWALAQMEDNRGLDELINWLKDKSCEDRIQAALSLGKLKDKRGLEPLINCLKKTVILDPYGTARDVDLIKYTSEAIAAIGDTSAVGPLIKILKDYPELSDIVDALKKLTGQDFGDNYEEWLKWWRGQK